MPITPTKEYYYQNRYDKMDRSMLAKILFDLNSISYTKIAKFYQLDIHFIEFLIRKYKKLAAWNEAKRIPLENGKVEVRVMSIF